MVEVSVGLVCLLHPVPPGAFALGALYVGFAGFLAFLVFGRAAVASCGCGGVRQSPPSIFHAGLNVAAATSGLAVAIHPIPSLPAFMAEQSIQGVPFLIGTACIGYLANLAVLYLPRLFFSYRPHEVGAGRGAGPTSFRITAGQA